MELSNKQFGFIVEINRLTQRRVESFFRSMREAGVNDMDKVSIPEYQGAVVRAAVQADILQMDVDDAEPALVAWLAPEVRRLIIEAVNPPKNS